MRRIAVDSTSIASIGYHRRTQTLELEFRGSGQVYRYRDVPAPVYADFMAAESKGTYLNQVFKPKAYPCSIVERRGRKGGNRA